MLGAWSCAPTSTATKPAPQTDPLIAVDENQPSIRVSLSRNDAEALLAFNGEYIVQMEEARYRLDGSVGVFKVFIRGGRMLISSPRRFFDIEPGQTVRFFPRNAEAHFNWNKVPYSGEFHLLLEPDQKILAINQLPIETYLQGVVPFEIPTQNLEYQEAVYAQAIAARSYAAYRLENPVDPSFNLYADTRDQVYGGMHKRTALSAQAIQDTRGMILTKNSAPVITEYHSTSGGVLDVEPGSESFYAGYDGSLVYDRFNGEFNDKVSPYFRWAETREAETVLRKLRKEFAIDSVTASRWIENGFALDIDVSKRNFSGRVLEVNIQIEDRSFFLEGFRIRRVLGNADGKSLPSNYFFLKKSPKYDDRFFIIGAGAGHGRGMSQWGAIGLSLKGLKYTSILDFYYPNLSLAKYY